MTKLEKILVALGEEKRKDPIKNAVHVISVNKEAQDLIDDLQNYPHAYVLSCLMDRQIPAPRAWEIPYKIKTVLNTFEIQDLAQVPKEKFTEIFNHGKLHRFNEDMAGIFYEAIQKICNDYDGNAAQIWSDCPSSAKVVYNFLQFSGCGIKIATMAANILTRQYGVQYSDYTSIDVSPDIHVRRTMMRMCLIPSDIKLPNGKHDINTINNLIIYKAREMNPRYPGIIDYTLWKIGRDYCHPKDPDCEACEIFKYCPRLIKK